MARAPLAKPLTRLALAAAAIILFSIGYYWGNQYKRSAETPPVVEGVLIRPPVEIPSFELKDVTGQSFTAKSLSGHWTLLSFGDPGRAQGHLAITRMIEVRNRLASDPDLQKLLQLALVAGHRDLVPARDFAALSPALRLLTGEPGQLEGLRSSLGAPAKETPQAALDDTPTYLIGPAGRLLAVFLSAEAPASIASDISSIAAHTDSLFPTKIKDTDVPPKDERQEGQDSFPRAGTAPHGEGDVKRVGSGFPGHG